MITLIPILIGLYFVLANWIESLTVWVEQIIHSLGLPGIVLIALLENLFPPTPSEFLYPLAGKLASDGALPVLGVIVAGVLGSLIGSLSYYGLGRWLGAVRARRMIVRYGRIKVLRFTLEFIAVEDYDRAVRLFQQRGGVIVLVARLMPLVHSAVSLPAGVTQMRLLPFIVYTAVGSTLWIAPLTLFGLWLGNNWEDILYWMDIYEYVWYAVFAVAISYWIVRRIYVSRKRRTTDNSVT